jgi:hypothetical protein
MNGEGDLNAPERGILKVIAKTAAAAAIGALNAEEAGIARLCDVTIATNSANHLPRDSS